MSDSNQNDHETDRSETETPGILNIEEILKFDKNKRDDRDSVDTLELIRDSADLTKRSTHRKQKIAAVDQEIERPIATQKELSTMSSNFNDDDDEDKLFELKKPNETSLVSYSSKFDNNENDDFKDTPSELEITNEANIDTSGVNNYIENDNPSRQSISSTQSSLNLGPNVYPLSIVEKPDEKKTDKNEEPQDDSKYKIDKNVPDDEIETADLAHLEPKLREAWIKMRKLDKILERAYQKERMIKRETIKLIEKNRADLEVLRLTSDHKESKQEAENTAHFLALSYFDLDDEIDYKAEDIKVNNEEPSTPVFKTQVLDDLISNYEEPQSSNTSQNMPKRTESIYTENSTNQQKKSDSSSKSNTTKTSKSEKLNKKNAKSSNDKDFIKRNIQLVQDAGGALAMTEEEKARLNELLLDTDETDEKNKKNNFIKEGADDNATYLVEYNPFSVSLAEGDGFTPDRNELQRLREIDSKLENKRNNSRLTSESLTTIGEQFKGIGAFSVSGKTSKYSLNNTQNIDADSYMGLFQSESRQIRLNDEFDENEFGDKFIREARITREQENRLKYIDSQLEKFKITSQSNGDLETIRSESTSSLISQQQMKILLQECANELSEEGSICYLNNKLDTLKEEDLVEENSYRYSETNNDRLSIVPVLNDNVIQSLLEQAKIEGIYSEPDRISSEPVQSYYEEALEIVNSHRKLTSEKLDTNQENEIPVVSEKEDLKLLNNTANQFLKNDSDTDDESDSKTYVSTSPQLINNNNNGYKYSNDSEDPTVNSNKLPPLYAYKPNKEESNEPVAPLNEARSSSSMSNLSSTSTSSLPKISSRYLPK